MIPGKHDTYYTVAEFAAMVQRSEKTVRNWATSGRLKFVHLFGVPLVSLASIENLLIERVPHEAKSGKLARRLMGADFG